MNRATPSTATPDAAIGSAGVLLHVAQWAGWAPGLTGADAWHAWLRAPAPLPADAPAAPPLAEVPAMARRRIDPLGRAALQVAYWAQQDMAADAVAAMPLVFASRWGELARSVVMLQELARGEALSPTAFSHSVHNAVGAQYSIQRGITANVSAVAAGAASAAAGWVEAQGLLAAGAPAVLLTVFDAPLPAPYDAAGLDAALSPPHAFALRLRLARAGEAAVQFGPPDAAAVPPAADASGAPALPPSLQWLQWLLDAAAPPRTGEPPVHGLWTHVTAR